MRHGYECSLDICLDTVTPVFHEIGHTLLATIAFSSQKDASWHSQFITIYNQTLQNYFKEPRVETGL